MKKTFTLLLAALLLATPTKVIASEAIPDYGVAPCWENMSTVIVDIGFSGTNGLASVTADRILGVTTSIEATLTVYRKVGNTWVYVTSTSGSSSRSLNLDVEFTGIKGATYKAVAEVTATGTEGTDMDTISETCVC